MPNAKLSTVYYIRSLLPSFYHALLTISIIIFNFISCYLYDLNDVIAEFMHTWTINAMLQYKKVYKGKNLTSSLVPRLLIFIERL